MSKAIKSLGKLGLFVVIVACLISLLSKSDLLLNNAPKIFQNETFSLLISCGTVRVESAMQQKVSQKNKPLVISRLGQSLEEINQPRLHCWIAGIIHRDDARLAGERSAEQEQVDHGIQRTLVETRANELILVLSPTLPLAFVRLLQLRRQFIAKRLEDWVYRSRMKQ